MATQTLLNEAQFDALPEEVRDQHELLDGELVELASALGGHQILVTTLTFSLHGFFRTSRIGGVIPDVEFALAADSLLRPDVAVLLGSKWQTFELWKLPIRTIPDIAIEIVSPSESAYHVRRKNYIYRESGVAEIWTIYPTLQEVDIDAGKSTRRLSMQDSLSTSLLPGWELSLVDLFSGLTQLR